MVEHSPKVSAHEDKAITTRCLTRKSEKDIPGPVALDLDVATFQPQFVKYPPYAQVVLLLQGMETRKAPP